MRSLILAALLTSTTVLAAETKIYGAWLATDSVDEFTQKKSCGIIAKAKNAGKYDTQLLKIQYDGKLVNDSGELIDVLGFYMETKYSMILIKSATDAQVLIDGSPYEFGSNEFLTAAKKGTEMTIRVSENDRRVYTRKYSLSGFTSAWNDVAARCSE